ncbi:hypothetical protein CHU32_01770 [Superficieibacter electus]|uniref:Uncharacterized protein n=1 Tax=Superficieibacter electus TaxID=2022662 RepID=A0A2P5GWH3_9ENTR|nr:hypothetical protein [Superficieibacter electus]POP47890.1 hypothetical protein CHU33_01765 [Superficieibacter electus]POP50903.1 hypothetical protein CHU32_01770 [Superficieibacter electus]
MRINIKNFYEDKLFSTTNCIADNTFVFDCERNIYLVTDNGELQSSGFFHSQVQLTDPKIAFHPAKFQAVTILETGDLALCDFNGNIIWQAPGNFEVVCCTDGGEKSWTLERINEELVNITLFATASGQLLATLQLADEIYDSVLRLADIPASASLLLEFAGGQDGISVVELTFKEQYLHSRELFPGNSYILPAITPDNTRILTLENDKQTYAVFRWPQLDLISHQESQVSDNDNVIPGYDLIYLRDNLAITQNAVNEYFLFNPLTMTRLEQIHFYKALLTTEKQHDATPLDISSLTRVGRFLAASVVEGEKRRTLCLLNEADFIHPLL